jgi:myo-inositol 2-dehydrogenase/D-chiro-inositol 1-dehydrogenase
VGAAAHDMSSEMILLGSAIHDLDAMRWLLGQELESVYVEGVATKPALEEDVLDLLLLQVRLRGGCLASVEVYVAARYGYEVGVEIVGTQGTALIDAPQGLVVRRERWRGARIEADWLERFQQAYVTELRAWVEAVRAGTHTGPDAWAGYASLAGAVAAIEALQSGNPTPVPLQERPELYQSSDAGA